LPLSRKKKLLFVAFAALLSGTLCVVVSEVAVRLFVPQNLSGSWKVANDFGLLVNKSHGSSRHQFGERVVRYHFFEPHLRDTPVDPDATNVLLLGDSYTFGMLLDHKDTYLYRLQTIADDEFGAGRINFLNGGAGGWGAADYTGFVEDYGEEIDPDMIVVFINTDDIGRAIKRNSYRLSNPGSLELTRHVAHASKLKQFVNAVPGYQWILEHSHLVQLLRTRVPQLLAKAPKVTAQVADSRGVITPSSGDLNVPRQESILLGRALFTRLQDWCNLHDVSLCVTTIGLFDHGLFDRSDEPTIAFMSSAEEFFRSRGVPFSDSSPTLYARWQADADAFQIPVDSHPNEAGAALIAETSWPFIRDQITTLTFPVSAEIDEPKQPLAE